MDHGITMMALALATCLLHPRNNDGDSDDGGGSFLQIFTEFLLALFSKFSLSSFFLCSPGFSNIHDDDDDDENHPRVCSFHFLPVFSSIHQNENDHENNYHDTSWFLFSCRFLSCIHHDHSEIIIDFFFFFFFYLSGFSLQF